MFDNYFTLFGLPQQFSQDSDKLQAQYYQLQAKFHPDQFIQASVNEQSLAHEYSAKISKAYQTLNDPFLRAQYLLTLKGKAWDEENASQALPMEYLIEQMALRETLEALQSKPNPTEQTGWQRLKKDVAEHLSSLIEKLSLVDDPKTTLTDIYTLFQQIPFYQRLKASIEDFETTLPSMSEQ